MDDHHPRSLEIGSLPVLPNRLTVEKYEDGRELFYLDDVLVTEAEYREIEARWHAAHRYTRMPS